MATLYVRDDIIWIRFSDNGKQILKSTKFRDTKEGWKSAKELRQQIEGDLQSNVWNFNISKHKRLKISEGIRLFNISKYGIAETTQSGNYYSSVKLIIEQIGDIYIDSTNDSDITKYKNYLLSNYAHATACTYTRTLRLLYNHFIKLGYYNKKNPIVKIKAILQTITTIPENELETILNTI